MKIRARQLLTVILILVAAGTGIYYLVKPKNENWDLVCAKYPTEYGKVFSTNIPLKNAVYDLYLMFETEPLKRAGMYDTNTLTAVSKLPYKLSVALAADSGGKDLTNFNSIILGKYNDKYSYYLLQVYDIKNKGEYSLIVTNLADNIALDAMQIGPPLLVLQLSGEEMVNALFREYIMRRYTFVLIFVIAIISIGIMGMYMFRYAKKHSTFRSLDQSHVDDQDI